MNIKIIVATHKPYTMPKDDMYIPVHVGKEGKEDIGFVPDNSGDHISHKNPFFCELTGIYWAWKNLDADYIGLTHYRRHLGLSKVYTKDKNKKNNAILSRTQLEKILEETDVVLPKKRKYYFESIYSHYKHTMYIEPLDECGLILSEKYPEYINEFNNLHTKKSAHLFNMFIMKREVFEEYCTWLFDILFELEKRIDCEQYDSFHARFFGRVSERLLDVWINTNNIKYTEIPVIEIDNVNWFKKGFSFFIAKLTHKKYKKSF